MKADEIRKKTQESITKKKQEESDALKQKRIEREIEAKKHFDIWYPITKKELDYKIEQAALAGKFYIRHDLWSGSNENRYEVSKPSDGERMVYDALKEAYENAGFTVETIHDSTYYDWWVKMEISWKA